MAAVQRANALFREQAIWLRMMRQAMTRDFSWAAAARQYAAVYRELRPDLVSSAGVSEMTGPSGA
jgi:glycogen synthase